jgi:hypothetical protein
MELPDSAGAGFPKICRFRDFHPECGHPAHSIERMSN